MAREERLISLERPDRFASTGADFRDARDETKLRPMRQSCKIIRRLRLAGRRGGDIRAAGRVLLYICGQRRHILKDLLADSFTGDLDLELLFDAGHQQEDIERIQVHIAAEE